MAPPELNFRDYAIYLLYQAAEIEHSLMIEYLFAAYTLGGPQVPNDRLAQRVRRWQETILGIAKEEMGHFMTVQNVLASMGAPIHLDRQEYPSRSDFYPFDFNLKRMTVGSLAEYVLAESATDWNEGELTDEVRRLAAKEAGAPVNHVGALYDEIDEVLASNRERGGPAIPDSTFQAQTLPLQASWDTWGRGYRRGERGQDAVGLSFKTAPELLIRQVVSRDTARSALQLVAEQGEAPGAPVAPGDQGGEESHFVRFRAIYLELRALSDAEKDRVSRPVAENPVTQWPLKDESPNREIGISERESYTGPRPGTNYIEDELACQWGHLFNLRYRMLLVNIAHSMHPIAPGLDQIPVVDRGIVINRTFGEMYNLRIIAGQLVQLPLATDHPNGDCAGPPFELPYTLAMPSRESNRWRLQLDLLEAARALQEWLLPRASERGRRFLNGLRSTDEAAMRRVERIIAGEAVMTLDERPA